MKAATLLALTLATAVSVHADFSYTSTRRTTGGMMAAMAGANGNQASKYSLKGQKMKVDSGDTAIIMDFDAQTITTISNSRKTVSVKSFNDVGGEAKNVPDVKVEVKETGQKKMVNGFNASELLMTMEMTMDSPGGRGPGKMQMEVSMWLSRDVPGAAQQRAFYEKNMSRFPFAAMGAGGNPGMQAAMAEMQKKVAAMEGVQVEQVIRMKQAGGGPGMPQMSGDQAAKMQDGLAKARAQLEAMVKQGGPGAAMAQQQLARLPAPPTSAGGGGASAGVLMEITVDSSDFSTSEIPDSVFAIPAGYQSTK